MVVIAPKTKGWVCSTCHRDVHTYQVTCAQCGKEKYPTLSAKPARYVCQLCLSEVGAGRQKAAQSGWIKRRAKIGRSPRETP